MFWTFKRKPAKDNVYEQMREFYQPRITIAEHLHAQSLQRQIDEAYKAHAEAYRLARPGQIIFINHGIEMTRKECLAVRGYSFWVSSDENPIDRFGWPVGHPESPESVYVQQN